MNTLPFIVQGNNIVVVIENRSHTISKKTHIAYNKVLDAIKAQDWQAVCDLIEPKKVILKYGAGNLSIQGEDVFYKGEKMDNSLTRRMVSMFQEGFPVEPMVAFMDNLQQNPSKRAVTELYSFLEKNQLPITPDGCFLAYKKVREDYKDCYTGTIDNSIGQKPSMVRNMVDDDQNRTCSTGLHFCSVEYLQSFHGNHTMILKINPRDVVAIPTDYNDSKGRCCAYEVVGELGAEVINKPEEAFPNAVDAGFRGDSSSFAPF